MKLGLAALVLGAPLALSACNQNLPPTNGPVASRTYTPAAIAYGETILGDPASEGPIESNATWELWVHGADHKYHFVYVGPKVYAGCTLGATWYVKTRSCRP